ncbi:MAG: hypothetical protein CR997_04895 [Acidobacteria bacterium]|nr:MAG: hypothetical protein CR997_04895 [Acidobacteriota bacterium]
MSKTVGWSLFALGLVIQLPFFDSVYLLPKLLLLSCAIAVLFLSGELTKRAVPLWIFTPVVWAVLSLLWSPDRAMGLSKLALFSVLLLPLSFQLKGCHKTAQKALLAAAWITMSVGFLQHLNIPVLPVETPGITSSTFGNVWLSSMFILLCLWFLPLKETRKIHIVAMMLYILLSGSTSVLLGLGYWLITTCHRQLPGGAFSAVTLIILLATATVFAFAYPKQLTSYLVNPDRYVREYSRQSHLIASRDQVFKGKSLSAMTRIILWKNSLQMIREKPLSGFGVGQFRVQYPRFSQSAHTDFNLNGMYRPVSTHNFLLTGAVELGLVWLVGVLCCLFYLQKNIRQPAHRHALLFIVWVSLIQPLYLTLPLWSLLILTQTQVKQKNDVKLPQYLQAFILIAVLFNYLALSLEDIQYKAAQSKMQSQQVPSRFPQRKAELCYREGNNQKAFELFQKALKSDPYSPELLYNSLQSSNLSETEKSARKAKLKNAFPFFRPLIKSPKTSDHCEKHKKNKDLQDPLTNIRIHE